VPVFAAWGTEDTIHPYERTRLLQRYAPQTELLTLGGAGHAITMAVPNTSSTDTAASYGHRSMTAVARHATLGDAAVLMLEFARKPSLVGALAPVRGALPRRSRDHPCDGDPVVVELGPGTGAFTEAIQARLGTRGRHIAVELNPRLATLTASRHRGVDMVHASADTLPEILADRGIANADFIVSGLPWVSMPAPVAEATLDAARSVLAPDGAFTTLVTPSSGDSRRGGASGACSRPTSKRSLPVAP